MREPDGQSTRTSQIGRYGGHGITLGLSVALFAWLGLKLDTWLDTEPLLIVTGAFLGFVGGFYRMYRDLVILPREQESRDDGNPED